jgi:preprotein translocase subunit SecA
MLQNFDNILKKIKEYTVDKSLLSNCDLKSQTVRLKEKVQSYGLSDNIIAEAFSIIKETAKRLLGEIHYDVQILAALILNRGMIAEMKTGEGKTLASSLAVYLNALEGKNIHIITINDYLAKRDAYWMGKIYTFHNFSVGYLIEGVDFKIRKKIYKCDIIYGTNNEFAFDYLKSNLNSNKNNFIEQKLSYAIVDEVDNILIDESITPLVICGASVNKLNLYYKINNVALFLKRKDYIIEHNEQNIFLSEQGVNKCEFLMRKLNIISERTSIYDIENINILHYINQAIKAHKLLQINIDYIVQDGKIVIIDSFTGRMLPDRKYAEGLHQAVEAKEHLEIKSESQVLASITFQSYFNMYSKLSGMTGTAITEMKEFEDIYKVKVFSIPTHFITNNINYSDVIYRMESIKNVAILLEIEKQHIRKQPILIGTLNIQKSELISSFLTQRSIKHRVLNAKFHLHEAQIISQAGKEGAITIATNMAGRGTDIKLGGNEILFLKNYFGNNNINKNILYSIRMQIIDSKYKVINIGGLYVIGAEKNETRRIDEQLKGRSARHGDIGKSKIFISLQDKLIKIIGNNTINNFLKSIGIKEHKPIEHTWLSKALSKAQMKIENKNYTIRKSLFKFDNILNQQRKNIYNERYKIISKYNSFIKILLDKIIIYNKYLIDKYVNDNYTKNKWQIKNLKLKIYKIYGISLMIYKINNKNMLLKTTNYHILHILFQKIHKKKQAYFDNIIKKILIVFIDQYWREYIQTLDKIKTNVNLRTYGQKNPFNEYQLESSNLLYFTVIKVFEVIITYVFKI